jgi:signal transduction histidine kinase
MVMGNTPGSGTPSWTSATPGARLDPIEAERELLGNRLDDFAALADLTADASTVEILQTMLEKCLLHVGCRSGSIFLMDTDSGELEVAVAEGPMREDVLGSRRSVGEGIAGRVAETREGIYVEDISQSSEFAPSQSGRYQTNSFACVPVLYHDELVAVLCLSDKESGDPFDRTDVGRVLAMAGFSAGAIRQSIHQRRLRKFNIELHRRLDAAMDRLEARNQELARLKNFNEGILTSLIMGLIAFDDQLQVTFSNRAALDILQISDAESLAARFRELAVNCDGLPWPDALTAVVHEGRAIRCGSAELGVEGEGPARSEGRILNLLASPLRDVQRRVNGGVVVFEDVTDRVRMERRLAASERHAVIGKLAARVAHELNNPLDGILRFINLSIALKGEEDQTREYLTECKKGLERMVGIVSSLLEFSRSTYPGQSDTDLNEVIEEAVRTLRHRADQQRIQVNFDLEPGIPEMRCGELVQVFLNLTKNAYDAMKEGGEFTVTSRLHGDEAVVTVGDSGCGMPVEIVGRIFDPFFTTKGPSEGTGLGLAICHDIVEKHGGTISAESIVNQGTTFTITLPVR